MKLDELLTKKDLVEFELKILEKMDHLLKPNLTPKLLRNADLKKMLKLSDSAIQNLRIQGQLPYSKIGGTIYYKLEDVEKLFEKGMK